MRIVNGKKFYNEDIRKCIDLHVRGWDVFNGRDCQQYDLYYNPVRGLVILEARSTRDGFGQNGTYYYASPRHFVDDYGIDEVARLLGNIDEDSKASMRFVKALGLPRGGIENFPLLCAICS